MTPALIREAEKALAEFMVTPADDVVGGWVCEDCLGWDQDDPASIEHAPGCLLIRVRSAADQMEGMVLVPLEPTEAMKKAAFGGVQYGGRTGPITKDFLRQAAAIMTYKAMIAAVRKTEQEG